MGVQERNDAIRNFVAQMMAQRGQTAQNISNTFKDTGNSIMNILDRNKTRKLAREAEDRATAQRNKELQMGQLETSQAREDAKIKAEKDRWAREQLLKLQRGYDVQDRDLAWQRQKSLLDMKQDQPTEESVFGATPELEKIMLAAGPKAFQDKWPEYVKAFDVAGNTIISPKEIWTEEDRDKFYAAIKREIEGGPYTKEQKEALSLEAAKTILSLELAKTEEKTPSGEGGGLFAPIFKGAPEDRSLAGQAIYQTGEALKKPVYNLFRRFKGLPAERPPVQGNASPFALMFKNRK